MPLIHLKCSTQIQITSKKYCKMYLNVLQTLDCIKNVDTLFLKSDNMKPEKLDYNFETNCDCTIIFKSLLLWILIG